MVKVERGMLKGLLRLIVLPADIGVNDKRIQNCVWGDGNIRPGR
jgi:hypothetical protein